MEATVSRHIITPKCPQVPEGDSQAVQSFRSGLSGLAASPSRSSDATAAGLGLSQPGSRVGLEVEVKAPQAAPLT